MEQAKSAFSKREIGLVLGVIVGAIVWVLPLQGISPEGQKCLALSLMTVVFWAFQITQPGYTSGLYLALLVVLGVAGPDVVFKSWTGTTMWLVVGAYLIATAVKTSGLGERIAYHYLLRFVSGYKSIIIGIFILTFVLSILIPHPWPRALLIMSVMAVIIQTSNIPKEDGVKIGFTVFAASVPVSLIFLTGDAVINPLAVEASGGEMGFTSWLINMGPPALIASILTCLLILVLFKPTQEVEANKGEIKQKLEAMGPMSAIEKRTLFWIIIAIALWMTDTIHGIHIGWITLAIPMLMSMPVIGKVLTPKDWSAVPMQTLVFLTAAIAIGVVGGVTGMNAWIADTLLPSTAPSNLFLLAGVITLIVIGIHMVLGSVIAVMGVAVPAIIAFTAPMGIDPLVPTLIAYMAIAGHYILPFHHLNVLVGAAEDTGGYTQKDSIRLGVPLIAVMFITTVGVMVPWFSITGLL